MRFAYINGRNMNNLKKYDKIRFISPFGENPLKIYSFEKKIIIIIHLNLT